MSALKIPAIVLLGFTAYFMYFIISGRVSGEEKRRIRPGSYDFHLFLQQFNDLHLKGKSCSSAELNMAILTKCEELSMYQSS